MDRDTGPSDRKGGDLRNRLPSLTGLRFAAAFLVFGFHLQVAGLFRRGSAGDTVAGQVFGHGAVGVSFFFLLSGFVLTWSARPGERARRIWRRRAAKIYPNHVITAVAALVGATVLSAPVQGATSAGAVLPNLLLVQSWVPDPKVYFGLNTVSWSLSCEAFFYLLFPWLLRALARVPPHRLWLTATTLAALTWCLPLVTLGWSEPTAYWFLYVLPATRALEFGLGMALARIVASGRWPRLPVWAAGLLLALAYVSVGYLPTRFGYVAATVVPLALLLPTLATADTSGRRTFWSRRWMVRLGELSFAFYLVHQLVIRVCVKVLHAPAPGASGWGTARVLAAESAMLAASLGTAWLLWRVIERPFNDLLRGRPSSA